MICGYILRAIVLQKDLEKETVYDQFLIVKAQTIGSTVHEYGQLASIYECICQ